MLLEYIDFGEAESPPDGVPVIAAPQDYTDDRDEFMQRRAGKITASKMADMMAGGKGLTRDKYKVQLAIERITGNPIRGGFTSRATEHGNAAEAEALELYEFQYGMEVIKAGFTPHPRLDFAGCSPDALVGEDGMAQVKCPDQHTFVGYLLTKKVPRDYFLQMQWEMACCGRAWSDFVCFDPDQIPRLRLLVIRVMRDDAKIAELEAAAVEFNQEIDALVGQMRNL